ncbi:hypothetical protein L195_g063276, partial [Trifolium pratense]
TMPLRIEGREVKKLRNKDIASVKVVWGRPAGENATWELGFCDFEEEEERRRRRGELRQELQGEIQEQSS